MERQKIEPIVIDLQKIQQLKDYINQEIIELLNNSKISKAFDKYGISGQNILKVQCSLDITQFQGRDTGIGHQVVELSSEVLVRFLLLQSLYCLAFPSKTPRN